MNDDLIRGGLVLLSIAGIAFGFWLGYTLAAS
jgi:hypothetical protein